MNADPETVGLSGPARGRPLSRSVARLPGSLPRADYLPLPASAGLDGSLQNGSGFPAPKLRKLIISVSWGG